MSKSSLLEGNQETAAAAKGFEYAHSWLGVGKVEFQFVFGGFPVQLLVHFRAQASVVILHIFGIVHFRLLPDNSFPDKGLLRCGGSTYRSTRSKMTFTKSRASTAMMMGRTIFVPSFMTMPAPR